MRNFCRFSETLFFSLLFISMKNISITEVKNDPLFKLKSPKTKTQPELEKNTSNSISVTNNNNNDGKENPQSRKLVLDLFKTDSAALREKGLQSSVKKLVNILQLADSFHDDSNFDLNVQVVYKNKSQDSQTPQNKNNTGNQVLKARELNLTQPKKMPLLRNSFQVPTKSMAIIHKDENIDQKPKSKFEFPKHFFKAI